LKPTTNHFIDKCCSFLFRLLNRFRLLAHAVSSVCETWYCSSFVIFPIYGRHRHAWRSAVCVCVCVRNCFYSTGVTVTGGATKLQDQDANTVICCPTLQHPRASWTCDNNCALSVLTAFGGLCLLYWEPGQRVVRVTTN
jgi:hypothetical protein